MRYDVIIIGAGIAGIRAASALQKSGIKTLLVSAGRSISEVPTTAYEAAGGMLLMGGTVTGGTFEGARLLSVRTDRLGTYELKADRFIIATGKFLGKGLVADMERIFEPVFGLDIDYEPDRSLWFDSSFGGEQRFLTFGVRTDSLSRPSIGGMTVDNLFACGELLHGVSAVTGMENIAASADAVVSTITSLEDAGKEQ